MKIARKLLCALIALMLFVGPGLVTATVELVTFECENLEAFIRDQLKAHMNEGDPVTDYLMMYKLPKQLYISNQGITSLNGLEKAGNLETLYLDGNPGINDISALQYLTKLTNLKLRDTNFDDLGPVVTLAQLPSRKLHTLYLENSRVDNFPTEQNKADMLAIANKGVTIHTKVNYNPDYVPVTGVTLSPTTLTLAVGEQKSLNVTIKPIDASEPRLHSWWSDKPTIATVHDGKVKGFAPGTTKVWVKTKDNHKTSYCIVTVTDSTAPKPPKPDPEPDPEPITVTEVLLSHSEHEMYAGDKKQLTATVKPKDAANKALTWASDNQDVATVDNQGKVTALAPGTAIITVTTVDGGKTATCVFTVKEKPEPKLKYELKDKTNSLLIPRELLDQDDNLEFKDGKLALYVPTAAWRGALIQLGHDFDELTVTVDQLDIDNPKQHKLIGHAYQFNLFAGDIRVHQFSDKLILEFSYDPQQVGDPDKLAVYWYNPETGQWDKLPSIVDVKNNTVTTLIDHWSKFALLEELPEEGVSTWVYYAASAWLLAMVLITVYMFKRR